MNRKFSAPALALALLGGVYMACGTANASNMGFKLERSFAHVDGNKNLYYVSFPLFNGVGDVCDEANATNVCQGQAGGAGDGMITVCDAACDLFTDISSITGGGVLAMSRVAPDCTYAATIIARDFFGNVGLTAGAGLPLEDYRDLGWELAFTQENDSDNRSVIVGSHDPSFGGVALPDFAACDIGILNLPYHSMYQTAYEVLCGLEITDWVDADADGNPDTCTGGIWDSTNTVQVAVSTFSDEVFTAAIANVDFFDNLIFPGTNYDLKPGEGYFFRTTEGYASQNWLSPHF